MNPYIAAGFLISGIFIGGLVTSWFLLVKCIVVEKTCETCKFCSLSRYDTPCDDCSENYSICWEPK